MKKAVISFLVTILVATTAMAGNSRTMTIVKQLATAERSKLPDNTIEYDMPQLEFNTHKGDTALTARIGMLIDSISNVDLNNSYYTLKLTELSPGTVEVAIHSLQELPQGLKNKAFYGTMGCCVVMRDGDSDELLKRIFTRSKSKVKLVQEYEIVEEVIMRHPALLTATIAGNQLTIHTLQVNGDIKPLE